MNPTTSTADTPRATRAVPRVLSIAGTDPTGGAGLQADLKSISAMGGYAMGVVTALVAQNTQGVREIVVPDLAFLRAQLDAVSDDVHIDAIKIGMLGQEEIVQVVDTWLKETFPADTRPLVVLDPVMIASSGDRLLDSAAERALLAFLSHADIITPNLPELAVIAASPVAQSWEEALTQAEKVSAQHGVVVILKGGHLKGNFAPDAIVDARGEVLRYEVFPGHRVRTKNTHGTGCSLSSALATAMAQTDDLSASLARVKSWLQQAIEHADELEVGSGNGPISHFYFLPHVLPQPMTTAPSAPATEPGTGEGAAKQDGEPVSERVADVAAQSTPHEQLWREIEPIFDATIGADFLQQLLHGTLEQQAFIYYLGQDTHYLHSYAQALRATSELAASQEPPLEEEPAFFAHSADQCEYEELALHNKWVQPVTDARLLAELQAIHPVTGAYLAHLQRSTGVGTGAREAQSSLQEREEAYAVAVAAILPCYWIYALAGEHLVRSYERIKAEHGPHSYGEWIEAYADEEFQESTRRVLEIFDRLYRGGSELTRARMRIAFLTSCELEREFFAMATLPRHTRIASHPENQVS